MTILTAAAATAVALSAQTSANAAPTTTTGQAKAQVDSDRNAAAAATEQYNGAQVQQQALQKKVNNLQDEIARQQAVVNKEMAVLGSVASAEYRQGSVDPAVQLMLSTDPTEYLNRASDEDQINSNQAALLDQLVAQQHSLAAEKAEAAQELGAQQVLLKQMQKSKAAIAAKLKHAQGILDALTPKQRVEVNAPSGGGGYTPPSSGSSYMSVSDIDLSGISATARTAMLAAMSKVNVAPYVSGGAGPNVFDCSGLVMWAYGKAGVSLPHYSYSDEHVGTGVSYSDLKVGDIIVNMGGDHVGLYAGNGMLLSAPHPGLTVDIQPLSYFGSIVAIRRF
ncbi:NlpC/P60 family protein [Streptacidiphilus sp. N1-12]|uniref:NlpC/P60 family protein n=2 Tax=Streptacidiphilus alkalitolerans TaxID=3342712 RepID=A0ABV6WB30_9ACTN